MSKLKKKIELKMFLSYLRLNEKYYDLNIDIIYNNAMTSNKWQDTFVGSISMLKLSTLSLGINILDFLIDELERI